MKIKKQPQDIKKEYDRGRAYISNLDLYDQSEKNQRFYNGDQWYGVKAPGMMMPVFNVIKRVVNYLIALIVANDITASINAFDETDDELKGITKIVSSELDKQIERNHLKAISREFVQDVCTNGTAFLYSYFDADYETHQTAKGMIRTEILDNTKTIFGNPYSADIQSQPYIIVVQRLFVDQVKEEARANGASNWDSIKADNDQDHINDDSDCLCTVLTKFWKETSEVTDELGNTTTKRTVKFIKTCGDVIVKDETDTGYTLYPLAGMQWIKRKNSYQGISPINEVIQNQIFINKTYAMAMVYMQANGFPRILYDSSKISALMDGTKGPYKVSNADLLGKIIDGIKVPDFSNQLLPLQDAVINMTKEVMGASDASLGNVNPENTSAIIAVQQATAVPLEIQKLAYRDCIEAVVRIYIDMMAENFGVRTVKYTDDEANPLMGTIDFGILKTINYELNVDIGDSAYWSELTQVNTLDNLFNKGIIKDPVAYLENVPDKYIKRKPQLIESIKKSQELAQQQAQVDAQNQLQKEAFKDAAALLK